MMTPRIAQIALRFGADDLDGAIVEERIYHGAGATTMQGLPRAGGAVRDDVHCVSVTAWRLLRWLRSRPERVYRQGREA